ncbi:MAG: FKBP-type peptidyl-prolyl cis-trans isomerase [Bacteroidaceae bacterium]|nr:FKBP-type peptidyl-prolyl cis-trans isomerase [Bacteroidaceae bacterium]
MDKVSYSLGMNIGRQLKQMGLAGILSVKDFADAVNDTLEGGQLKVSPQDAQRALNEFFNELEKKQAAAAAEKGKAAREEGEKFLKENQNRPGVQHTASGLQYQVLTEGTGRKPKATDTVRCHYHGTLIDGTVFDSSYQRGEPCEFGLNQVIRGWTEGVQLMSEGAKYRFFIPYNLAYGEQGAGSDIPPYSALIFDVELIKVL